MELADLHRRLDGSLRPATVAELATRLGVSVPEDLRFEPAIAPSITVRVSC